MSIQIGRDRLIVDDSYGRGYHLTWSLDDGDDLGGSIGDAPSTDTESSPDPSNRLCALAYRVAAATNPKRDFYGFVWESKLAADKMLAVIKAEWQALESKRPWPEWAKQAVANGWKAPRGWKP